MASAKRINLSFAFTAILLAVALVYVPVSVSAQAETDSTSNERLLSTDRPVIDGYGIHFPSVHFPGIHSPGIHSQHGVQTLRLSLSDPLTLTGQTQQAHIDDLGGLLRFSSDLNLQAGDHTSLGLNFSQSIFDYQPNFRPLGNIHCENGVMEAGSYHASNCQFISDELNGHRITDHLISLGPRWAPSDHISVQLEYFQQQTRTSSNRVAALLNGGSNFDLNHSLTQMLTTAPIVIAPALADGASVTSRAEGVDLDLRLGFTTSQAGNMELGLQLTRITDIDINMFGVESALPIQYSPIAPFNTAKLDFDWARGDFSGGLQTNYRESVEFFNNQSLDSLTTFDLHFTWRTPWNANLSIGASNLFDDSTELESDNQQDNIDDPFEMIYGRVPYVRYQQDL